MFRQNSKRDLTPIGALYRRGPAASAIIGCLCVLSLTLAACHYSTEPGWRDRVAVRDLSRAVDGRDVSRLAIQAQNGGITVTSRLTDRVSIDLHAVVRAGTDREAERFVREIEIRTEQHTGTLEVRARYPEPPRGVEVETGWTLTVPRGLDLDLLTVNGGVFFSGRAGAVEIQTENGSVTVEGVVGPLAVAATNGRLAVDLDELTGDASCATVNGSQILAFARGLASVSAATVNGAVRLTAPHDYSGRLDAETANGSVSCRIPLSDTEVRTRKRIRGTVGAGGPRQLVLRSVNGTIEVDRFPR